MRAPCPCAALCQPISRPTPSSNRRAPARRCCWAYGPEHVRLDPQGAWRGVVHLIEPMGNHQVVWLKSGEQLLAAIVEDHVPLQPDQVLNFQLDLARASLFDQASERAAPVNASTAEFLS